MLSDHLSDNDLSAQQADCYIARLRALDQLSRDERTSLLCHVERAAWHLYESIRPIKSLEWDDLSSGHRNTFRLLILDARDQTKGEHGER